MPTAFPAALDAFTNPQATDQQSSLTVGHAEQHTNANDAIEALQAKVGVTDSQVPSSLDMRIALLEARQAFPVGAIYISVTGVNPASELGYGTWTAFAAGRVLVGLDAGQTEFDALLETGGAKTHTLTTNEMPAHTHNRTGSNTAATSGTNMTRGSGSQGGAIANTSAGGGAAHNNLQPYVVVALWRRTA